ncbi:hypothetical protein E2C01_055473 [Portunus trituberculatus]|uniref:Transmembrane protein n=1 Tax=Portunus trituberculatus TaxID=210409 RepID=A0A5B7GMT9_PORTR|nr:hypothetical protein [Portunus trituberculatus]
MEEGECRVPVHTILKEVEKIVRRSGKGAGCGLEYVTLLRYGRYFWCVVVVVVVVVVLVVVVVVLCEGDWSGLDCVIAS